MIIHEMKTCMSFGNEH